MAAAPPYRIETERLVVRCWEPRDAGAMKEAIDSSIDHLRPWMPWAEHEPKTLDEKVELLRLFRGQFDLGQDFNYGVFAPDESLVLGGSGLHTRIGDGAFEIGYWIRADAIGAGLAMEVTAALTRVAFERCGADRIEVHVDTANRRSMRIPARLGFREEATLLRRLPPKTDGEPRDMVVFTIFATELAGSAAATIEYSAFDAAGRPLL